MDFPELFTRLTNNGTVNAGAIPTGYNGVIGTVDMAQPQDFIVEDQKIILTGNNEYSLVETLRYKLWIAQSKPGDTPDAATDVAITAETLQRFWPTFCHCVVRSKVYSMCIAAGVTPVFRQSDIRTAIGLRPDADRDLGKLYNLAMDGGLMEAMMFKEGPVILQSFFANGTHRMQNDDHSWFTSAAARSGSTTARCLGVAGSGRDQLIAYMSLHGHDGNHHLTTVSLSAICDALSGHVPAVISTVAGRDAITYRGETLDGDNLHIIIDVGEAARTRWPAGKLGQSALIVGLQMMATMVMHMSTKLKIEGANHVFAKAEALALFVRENGRQMSGADIKALEAKVATVLSITYGYVSTADLMEDDAFQAFRSHAERQPSAVGQGKALAQAVMTSKTHDQAISNAVVTSLTALAGALDSVGATPVGNTGVTVSALPAINTAKISAEVGKSDLDKLMASGKADTFFNALEG